MNLLKARSRRPSTPSEDWAARSNDSIDADPKNRLDSPHVQDNPVYGDDEEEPELHWRTFVAIAAMLLLNLVQVFALEGPPTVLTYMGESLNATAEETWIPNSLSLMQAVVGPIIASVSDKFQARKSILIAACTISFVGSAIAPGAENIGRLIAAQTLIGFGFASVPLAYSVPSEILPRRWRPIGQGLVNLAAALGAIAAPLTIGGLVEEKGDHGWSYFYWIQMALWGAVALGLLFGYRPPKRHTELEDLNWQQKLLSMDLMGIILLMSGLTLTLTGLTMGGGLEYPWDNSRVLGTLITGGIILILFALYEWRGTSTGILHHDLFHDREGEGNEGLGRTFALCMLLIFFEGTLLFAFMIFYPILTVNLFETNPFLQALRGQAFWFANAIVTGFYGLWCSRFRSFRTPLVFGFTLFTAGFVGLATIEPDDSTNAIVFAALAGAGFGAPFVLIVSAAHLAVPHEHIATATAVITSTRGIAASMFTAIFNAAFNAEETANVPAQVAPAVMQAGLPSSSVPSFIAALSATNQTAALMAVPDVTPEIIDAGVAAAKQAFADSIRVVWEIAAPFGVVAIICCLFLGNLKKVMNYRVDAPVETLQAKRRI